MDGCAPGRVTEIDAAATAKRIASQMDLPSPNLAAKAPEKQSPAPTVSIAVIFSAGYPPQLFAPHLWTRRMPQVFRTWCTPSRQSFLAAVSISDF